MAQYLDKSMGKSSDISLIFCFSCGLNQWITGTECILIYIGVNIDISQTQIYAFSRKKSFSFKKDFAFHSFKMIRCHVTRT